MYRVDDGALQQVDVAALASALPTISTPELRQRIHDDDVIVVDTRPLPAYNGWRLANESAAATSPEPSPFLRIG